MKGDILPPDQEPDIEQGWVIDLVRFEGDELARVILRRDEHLYGIDPTGDGQHLQIVDMGTVQGVNRKPD